MRPIFTYLPAAGHARSPGLQITKRWFWLTAYGLILFSGISYFGARLLADADTYWHLAAGQWILTHRQVPTTDPFSFSLHGARWVTHEWLAEVVFAGFYEWLGWAGLVLITALAVSVTLTILLDFLLRYVEPLHAFAGTILALLTLTQHLLARPHTLAWPLMVIWISNLVKAREFNKPPSLSLLVVMLIWANLHASFILGIGFALAFAAEAIVVEGTPRQAARAWLPFVAFATVAALLTPNGLDGLVFPFQLTNMSYSLNIIGEWLPPDFRTYPPVEIWLFCMLFGYLYFGFRLPAFRIVMLVGLIHLALKSVRNAELLGLLAPLILMPSIGPQLRAIIRPERKPTISLLAYGAVSFACAILLTISGVLLARGVDNEGNPRLPEKAVQAAMAAGGAGPVFNSYDFGGYLIFSGIAPLIDGRADLYGDDFFRRYIKAYSGDTTVLSSLVREYKIRWAILEPSSPAAAVFNQLPGWRKVHEDKIAAAYVLDD